jgi:SH3-like domain-containing protein
MIRAVLICWFGLFFPLTVWAAAPYSETGLPVPRFVSLKSAHANMRKGPGVRYPIEWVYKRKHFPIEIINEFGLWRQVRDVDGVGGWMHKGMLSADRYAVVTATSPLHSQAEIDSDVILKVEKNVIVHLKHCTDSWCKIEVAQHEGWLAKASLWGVYQNETLQ